MYKDKKGGRKAFLVVDEWRSVIDEKSIMYEDREQQEVYAIEPLMLCHA